MRSLRFRLPGALALMVLAGTAYAQSPIMPGEPGGLAAITMPPLTGDAINLASLATLVATVPRAEPVVGDGAGEMPAPALPDPAVVRLQVLLDRGGASPGVIDGFDGDNVRKAVLAYETMLGLPGDGLLDEQVIAALEQDRTPVVGMYTIVAEDLADITGPVPADYADKALMDFLGYASVAEKLAERFHMDIDLLTALNPGAGFAAGEQVVVAAPGLARSGVVARIEADKTLRQVRAYDASGVLLAAYPATIGSESNPSPSGMHVVTAVAPMPNYTYNPDINFQQGENTEVLVIPPGPNGPVGSVWIDLTEPTFGIHGTPEPNLIDKVGSHGCVRLTNWDAEELAGMVAAGVTVEFIGAA